MPRPSACPRSGSPETSKLITRRRFVRRTSGLLAGAIAASSAPWIHARERVRLRVLGTHVTLQEEIRRRAEKDLGIEVVFEAGGSAEVLQKASTSPEQFDLYEQWSNSINVLWQSGSIQPIETDRIELWDEINDLSKSGRLTPTSRVGRGDAPYKILHVQDDGLLGPKKTPRVSFLPYVHNVDSFGYDSRFVPEGTAYETESWAWLLDDRWHGRVAVVNEPTIGLFDLALAAQAKGLMTFEDIGEITRPELDELFGHLIELKRQGHFHGVWNSVPHSIDLMRNGRVILESMFSPAVSSLNGMGLPVIYAAPKEGYRAWQGVLCLSSKTTGAVKDAAYRYMNWWLSGWPGAFIARQGYYISTPERAHEHLDSAEWDYWYEGKPATRNLAGTDGRTSVLAGKTRRGGSYSERFENVAVWNTVMRSYEYSLRRWYSFLIA